MKETTAEFSYDIHAHCPHCNSYIDLSEQLKEELGSDNRAENIEVEVNCSDCEKPFMVTEITF